MTTVRTRAEIEREIRIRRGERDLYVTPQNRAKVTARIDELLEEWAASADVPAQPAV